MNAPHHIPSNPPPLSPPLTFSLLHTPDKLVSLKPISSHVTLPRANTHAILTPSYQLRSYMDDCICHVTS